MELDLARLGLAPARMRTVLLRHGRTKSEWFSARSGYTRHPVRRKTDWREGGALFGQCSTTKHATRATWCVGGSVDPSPNTDRPDRSGRGHRMIDLQNARSRVKKRSDNHDQARFCAEGNQICLNRTFLAVFHHFSDRMGWSQLRVWLTHLCCRWRTTRAETVVVLAEVKQRLRLDDVGFGFFSSWVLTLVYFVYSMIFFKTLK